MWHFSPHFDIDTVVHAFIDTGADVSFISGDFRMSTPTLHQSPLMKQFIPLTSLSRDTLDSVGTLSVNHSEKAYSVTLISSDQKLPKSTCTCLGLIIYAQNCD